MTSVLGAELLLPTVVLAPVVLALVDDEVDAAAVIG